MNALRTFFQWLGYPFHMLGRAAMVLVNLNRQQMRSVFSLGMLGGIVAMSLMNVVMLYWAYVATVPIERESLVGVMALKQQFWNNAIMGGFALILGLVVWGADYLKAKFGDREIEAGSREDGA